jgi:hypothetical protein
MRTRVGLSLALGAALLLTRTGLAQIEPPDVRSVCWGMSPDRVKAMEGAPLLLERADSSGAALVYGDSLRGLGVRVTFSFLDDQLVGVEYRVTQSHADPADYIVDYHALRAALVEESGPPADEQTVWKEDLFREDPHYWGIAVGAGELVKWARWRTPRSRVALLLTRSDDGISLTVEYRTADLAIREQEARARAQAGRDRGAPPAGGTHQ